MENKGIREETQQPVRPGTLYVVSTPIGNLEDITLRALKILKSVDMIAAENVTHTRRLCDHYGIGTKVARYNQHNQKVKCPELVGGLKRGFSVALVTDAGTPGISDPGGYLINRAALESVPIAPIPGASAVTGAVSISGFPAEQFVFAGFLPTRSGRRKQALETLTTESRTMVFFEAPHRLKAMLGDLLAVLGNRNVVLVREMTKLYEEIIRGPIDEIIGGLADGKVKGELTLVVQGKPEADKTGQLPERVFDRIEALLAEKRLSLKDIAEMIASEEGFPYRRIYKECLSRKDAPRRT